jgi:hypothetical protein
MVVWLYLSPIPVGEEGNNFLVKMISTCLRYAWGGGGGIGALSGINILKTRKVDPYAQLAQHLLN